MSLYLLSRIDLEETCLVNWGYLTPFMVYRKDTPGYINQVENFADEAKKTSFIKTIAPIYDRNVESEDFFILPLMIGEWFNYSLLLQYLCMATILVESLNVMRMLIVILGFKTSKGFGRKLRVSLAVMPVVGMLLFFFEAMIVLDYRGNVCFCKFEKVYQEKFNDLQGYDCMRELADEYRRVVFARVFWFAA